VTALGADLRRALGKAIVTIAQRASDIDVV